MLDPGKILPSKTNLGIFQNSTRAVNRQPGYRPGRLVEPCSDRVIRGWGGASWHFQKDLGFCNLGGSFLEILKNPRIHFGREPFSRMKHQKIYRLSLLPSNFYSSGEFPSSVKVTNLSSQGGQNFKNHENLYFQAAPAPKTRFLSQGRCAAGAMFNLK